MSPKGRGLVAPSKMGGLLRVGRVRSRDVGPFGPRLDLRSRPPCSLGSRGRIAPKREARRVGQ
jgi:hypothetical protein